MENTHHPESLMQIHHGEFALWTLYSFVTGHSFFSSGPRHYAPASIFSEGMISPRFLFARYGSLFDRVVALRLFARIKQLMTGNQVIEPGENLVNRINSEI
jgi:hypothetical protein